MKDSRPNIPRPSQVIDKMIEGRRYTPTQMAFMFDCNLAAMQKLLKAIQLEGVIDVLGGKGRERQYHLPVVKEVPPAPAASRCANNYTPPLTDAMAKARAAFVAGCMAVRR